ncbi:MAG TPA: phosphatidylserine decarboxylase family protein [Thermodesulfovibrionales bacterium]|nr:phosphatidylserine decarboxylase family protein [Thermodesulfovibrionales bacterium]
MAGQETYSLWGMIKLAPEGHPFIFGFFGLTVLVLLFAPLGALLPFVLTLFMVYFFRDPERRIPEEKNVFVSPADGKVILIQTVSEDKFLKGDTVEVSIFMSPLDVHVNRAPCEGVVEGVVHTPGRFLSAFKHEASLQNENIAMLLTTQHGKLLIRQVAGFLARRAVCRVKKGDPLQKGERYGIIKFSSRLDIYLPREVQIKVKLGDRVKAGETVIGEMP